MLSRRGSAEPGPQSDVGPTLASVLRTWVSNKEHGLGLPRSGFIATDKQDPKSGTPSGLMSKYVHLQTWSSSKEHGERLDLPRSGFIATDKQDPKSGTASGSMSKYVHPQTWSSSKEQAGRKYTTVTALAQAGAATVVCN